MCNNAITKQVYVVFFLSDAPCLPAVLRVVGGTRLSLLQLRTFIFIFCSLLWQFFYYIFQANISMVILIKYINCLSDFNITKPIHVYFYVDFLRKEAARCCRALLEGPTFRSGSLVGLLFRFCY